MNEEPAALSASEEDSSRGAGTASSSVFSIRVFKPSVQ